MTALDKRIRRIVREELASFVASGAMAHPHERVGQATVEQEGSASHQVREVTADLVRSVLRSMVDARREFEDRRPDAVTLKFAEITRNFDVDTSVVTRENLVDRGLVGIPDLGDCLHSGAHNVSPSVVASVLDTPDAPIATVGDASDRSNPSGASGATSGGAL